VIKRKCKNALLWARLKSPEIEKLQKQYGSFFPDYQTIEGEPFNESESQVLQLEEALWFKRSKPYPIFLSYAPKLMNNILTITTYDETTRLYLSEIDRVGRQTARIFRRMVKAHGLNLKSLYYAKLKERKHPILKTELEERIKDLILRFGNRDKDAMKGKARKE